MTFRTLVPTLFLLLGLVQTAEAGWIRSCIDFFGRQEARQVTVQPRPGKTQMEAWMESFGNKPRAIPRSQELLVQGGGGAALSPGRVSELRRWFQETSRKTRTLVDQGQGGAKPSDWYLGYLLEHQKMASGVLESKGVTHLLRVPQDAKRADLRVEVVILPGDATPLNRLAAGMQRLHPGMELVYDPHSNWNEGFSGAFDPNGKTAILTSEASLLDGIRGSTTLRHELQHAYYHSLPAKGRVGWMHGSYSASAKQKYASPFREGAYGDYMSFEELATHGQDLRAVLADVVRKPDDKIALDLMTYKLLATRSIAERLFGVAGYVDAALSGLKASGATDISPSWTATIQGKSFAVRTSRRAEAVMETIRLEFLEIDSPARASNQALSGFEAEYTVPAGAQVEDLLRRSAEMQAAATRAADYAREVKFIIFGEQARGKSELEYLPPASIQPLREFLHRDPKIRNF